jgi:hypothetical protein
VTYLRAIAVSGAVSCLACNVVSGLTDFSVLSADAGAGAAGGGGSGGACADCGQHVWSDSYSPANQARGRCIAADQSGNVVVAGHANGPVDFGGGELGATEGFDVVVAKLGSLGSHSWSRRFGGTGQEWVNGLALDPSGDVLVVGSFERQMVFDDLGGEVLSAWQDDYDGFLARIDGTSGQTLWYRSFGLETPQSVDDVAVSPTGDVIVVGDFRANIHLAGVVLPQTIAGDHDDAFVARFDGDGNHLWSRAYGDGGADFARAVDVDSAGNIVVAGHFTGAIDFGGGPLSSEASPAAYVAKITPDGDHLWSMAMAGRGVQVVRGLDADADGIVVAGAFDDEIRFGDDTHHASKPTLYLVKLDQGGAIQWSTSFSGATDVTESGPIVALDSDANILLTGPLEGSASFGGDILTSVTDATDDFTIDVFVAKLDSAGQHLWSRSYGGTGQDYGAAIAGDTQQNVLVTGTFSGDVGFGGDLLKTTNASIFVVKLSP